MGGVSTLEVQVGVLAERGPRRVSPFTIPMVMPNAGAAALSLRFGLQGPCETITTACAAGTHSLGAGARLVADGRCDLVLAGGAESLMTPTSIASFSIMRALSPSGRSRPFDAARDGFCLSEGAAVLVLEEREAALARGARVLRRGARRGVDERRPPRHRTRARRRGRRRLHAPRARGRRADDVRRAGRQRARHVDAAERRGRGRRGHRRLRPGAASPSRGIKGVTGHSLGAAGALEAVSVLLSFAHRELPPTMGTTDVDPALELDVVLEPRPWEPGPTVSNSFGFGGHNGCLVLGPA